MEDGKSTAVLFFSGENKEFSSVATLTKTKRLVYFVHGMYTSSSPPTKLAEMSTRIGCTLSRGCFADIETAGDSSVVHGDTFYLCKRHYSAASLSSLCYIETLVGTSLSTHLDATVTIADEATSNSNHSSN